LYRRVQDGSLCQPGHLPGKSKWWSFHGFCEAGVGAYAKAEGNKEEVPRMPRSNLRWWKMDHAVKKKKSGVHLFFVHTRLWKKRRPSTTKRNIQNWIDFVIVYQAFRWNEWQCSLPKSSPGNWQWRRISTPPRVCVFQFPHLQETTPISNFQASHGS